MTLRPILAQFVPLETLIRRTILILKGICLLLASWLEIIQGMVIES